MRSPKPLEAQIREVLAQLARLSEAPSNWRVTPPPLKPKPPPGEPKPKPGHLISNKKPSAESKAPTGFRPGRSWATDEQPSIDFFTHDHFRYRFEHAASESEKRVLVARARAQIKAITHGPGAERIALRAEASEADDAEALVQAGQGVPAAEIAAETGWPIGWIRSQRERRGFDPELGKPRARFREMSHDERRALVARLHHQDGLDQRGVAQVLGVSKTTIHNYWPTRQKARAA